MQCFKYDAILHHMTSLEAEWIYYITQYYSIHVTVPNILRNITSSSIIYAVILRYMTNKCFCIAQFPWGQGMPRGVGCRLGWGTTVHTNQDLTGPKHN